MTKPTAHPHADMIKEAIQDVNRDIQVYLPTMDSCQEWFPSSIESLCADISGGDVFRFADTEEQKPKIVSSLTDDEIHEITREECRSDIGHRRAIADAAAQRAIEELRVPTEEWYGSALWGHDRIRVMQYITAYVSHIKEGKL